MGIPLQPQLQQTCKHCGAANPAEAYFCESCGKPLRPKPASTSLKKQMVVYLVSLFAPPFGLVYAWEYLRQPDAKSKKIGVVAILLTIISIIFTVWTAQLFIVYVSQQVNQQLNGLNGFY